MDVFAHPFRVAPDGSFVTVDDDSDAGKAQAVAVVMLTRPGERPLAPTFGLPDPTFTGVTAADVAAAVSSARPDITITAVDTSFTTDSIADVTVDFT